jgi:hypothetical protein
VTDFSWFSSVNKAAKWGKYVQDETHHLKPAVRKLWLSKPSGLHKVSLCFRQKKSAGRNDRISYVNRTYQDKFSTCF